MSERDIGCWGRELKRIAAVVRSWPLERQSSAAIRGISPLRHSERIEEVQSCLTDEEEMRLIQSVRADRAEARLAEVEAENKRLRAEAHRLRWTNRDLAMVPDRKRLK